jgi:uncharacterized protein
MTEANIPTTTLIVIQPTPFCNIDCSYCYLPNRSDRTTLSLDDLRRIFARLLTFPTVSGEITVVWHAGEPLVLPVDYYEAAFTAIRELCPGTLRIVHSFQTNGMLIDERWCDLFQRWNVGIGVSIDGPKHIHDATRKTRSGKGTFDKAVAGIAQLKKRNIPFYVISVLTRAAFLDPDAMFAFYEQHDIHDVGFNFEEEEGIHTHSSLSGDFDDRAVVSFFTRFSELMRDRMFPIAVRELEEVTTSIRYLQKEGPVNSLVTPFGIITIGVNGDVFTFSPELAGYSSDDFNSFAIGNIFRDSFTDLQNSPTLARMSAQISQGIEMCRAECPYFPVCGGGTPSNKVFEKGSFACTETMYCRLTKKRVTDFVLSTIEERAPAAPRRT